MNCRPLLAIIGTDRYSRNQGVTDVAKEAQRFEAVKWFDLLTALEQIAGEEQLRQAGLQYSEVTDLIQGQLYFDDPTLALTMPRIIEIRLPATEAVALLRTGIPVSADCASPEAGAFLLALRRQETETGDWIYLRYPRVKRMRNWKANLRRRLLDLAHDTGAGRETVRSMPTSETLREFLRPEADDLEIDLVHETEAAAGWPAKAEAHAGVARAEAPTIIDSTPAHGPGFLAGATGWGNLQAAGISLPVWLSVLVSLVLVLAAILPG